MANEHVGPVLDDLIETLDDGHQGFAQAAEQLAANGHPDLAAKMSEYSEQRRRFSTELRSLAGLVGHDYEEDGSLAGALHRGWMTLKDALTGDDPHAILAAAETGEDHAVREFDDALGQQLPPEVGDVVARQALEVRSAHDTVKALRDQH